MPHLCRGVVAVTEVQGGVECGSDELHVMINSALTFYVVGGADIVIGGLHV